MQCAETALEATYDSATVYVAGDKVYFPATKKYYQKTKQTPAGLAPAEVSNGEYETQTEYWQEVALAYTADDWSSGETYESGDIVRDPDTDTFYSCYESLDVRANFQFGKIRNGDYVVAGETNSKPYYAHYESGVLSDEIEWTGSQWQINSILYGDARYTSTEDVATPDLVSVWTLNFLGNLSQPIIGENDEAVPDEANWGALSVWTPDFTGIHWPRMISRLDPRLGPAVGAYEFEKTTDGVRIVGLLEPLTGKPWVWYRRNTPILTGSDWSATETYEATDENDLVFDS